ncbi:MAG: AraC family transcriptional regulator [Spirosomaceae bacterium]|jgi:AraC-like DNA-binding protein|nr:AraC family transcriptional regulator [Spirosomataceae bacterium]
MSQYSLHKGKSPELEGFDCILAFSEKKIQHVQPNSLHISVSEGIKIFYVLEGKFDWMVDSQEVTLYPNDVCLVLPWQAFGNVKGTFEVGKIQCIALQPYSFEPKGELSLGNWSSIPETELRVISRIFSLNRKPTMSNFKVGGEILQKIKNELFSGELGYRVRVNHLIDELLIMTARQLSRQENQRRDFPQTFQKLDQLLRENIAHPWTVEEMAGIVGLGTTAFTEKVKAYSGFSPLNYLINIRITEAIKLMKRTDLSLTDVALDTGFYSSQHFSMTFKKLTGFTPGQFRKNNQPKK